MLVVIVKHRCRISPGKHIVYHIYTFLIPAHIKIKACKKSLSSSLAYIAVVAAYRPSFHTSDSGKQVTFNLFIHFCDGRAGDIGFSTSRIQDDSHRLTSVPDIRIRIYVTKVHIDQSSHSEIFPLYMPELGIISIIAYHIYHNRRGISYLIGGKPKIFNIGIAG